MRINQPLDGIIRKVQTVVGHKRPPGGWARCEREEVAMFQMKEGVQLRPGQTLVQGMPRMLDFVGVLSHKTPTRCAEEDMALAWHEVFSVVKPPPPPRPSSSD